MLASRPSDSQPLRAWLRADARAARAPNDLRSSGSASAAWAARHPTAPIRALRQKCLIGASPARPMRFVPMALALGVEPLALLREFARVFTLAPRRPRACVVPPQTADPIPRPAVKTRIHAEDGESPLRLGLKARRQSVGKIRGMQAYQPKCCAITTGFAIPWQNICRDRRSRFYAVDCADMILMTAMQPSRGNMSNASAYARRC